MLTICAVCVVVCGGPLRGGYFGLSLDFSGILLLPYELFVRLDLWSSGRKFRRHDQPPARGAHLHRLPKYFGAAGHGLLLLDTDPL